MHMEKLIFKPLVSKKQLCKLKAKKVIKSDFLDENSKDFAVTFEVAKGKKIDLLVSFDTRTPRVFISGEY